MQTIPVEIVNTDWFQIGSNIILALAAVAAFVFSFITLDIPEHTDPPFRAY